MSDAGLALEKIAGAKATFVSRGDDSGTHTKEQFLWKASGVTLDEASSCIRNMHRSYLIQGKVW